MMNLVSLELLVMVSYLYLFVGLFYVGFLQLVRIKISSDKLVAAIMLWWLYIIIKIIVFVAELISWVVHKK